MEFLRIWKMASGFLEVFSPRTGIGIKKFFSYHLFFIFDKNYNFDGYHYIFFERGVYCVRWDNASFVYRSSWICWVLFIKNGGIARGSSTKYSNVSWNTHIRSRIVQGCKISGKYLPWRYDVKKKRNGFVRWPSYLVMEWKMMLRFLNCPPEKLKWLAWLI